MDWEEVIYFPRHAREWLLENTHWLALIVFGLMVFVIVLVLLTWLSSRGKFMFLDNVVHDRARVAAPWYEFRVEGNSLFLWSLTVGFIVLAIVVMYLVRCYSTIVSIYEETFEPSALIFPAIGMLLGLIGIFMVAGLLDLLLVDFVVPIMYRSRIRVLAAWGTFLPLLGSHLFAFVGYALFTLGLWILIVMGIVIAVILTCCIGGLLLVIPYINAVILLPVSYTIRAFSIEFLEQFGQEYQVFPRPLQDGVTTWLPPH